MSEVTVPEEGSPEQESPEAFGARAHAWVGAACPRRSGQAGLEVDDEHELRTSSPRPGACRSSSSTPGSPASGTRASTAARD